MIHIRIAQGGYKGRDHAKRGSENKEDRGKDDIKNDRLFLSAFNCQVL
jgi:hypothetical protein